jgi:hypothetical protein
MADRWPLANGNWSNAANWNGGTLPAVGDDVYADGKTVTIDQDVTVLSIRNDQRSGGTNGGTFTASGNFTINADILRGSLNSCLTFTGAGTFNINGSLTTNATSTANVIYALVNQGGGTINIVGNIITGLNNNPRGSVVNNTNNSTINITGNVTNANFSNTTDVVLNNVGSTLNIIGNISGSQTLITGTTSYAINNAGVCNITGIVSSSVGTSNATVINAGFLYINGIVSSSYNLNSTPALLSSATTAINTIQGNIVCSNYGDFPLSVRRMQYVPAANTSFQFADNSTNGALPPTAPPSTFTLYSADVVMDSPNTTDVRQGVVYADSLLTGTLAVPLPSDVRKSVPTDNTVGTADLTAQDFFDAIASSSDPIAIRLRNVATVETTGDQISAFNV